MNENGIMQAIRELLSQGFDAAEIIAQGYAPSTVYRVQRDTRRKLTSAITPYHKVSTNHGLEHLGDLEADNQRLHQRLDFLESQLSAISEQADVGPVWEQLEERQRSLEKIATQQEQITRQIQAHNAIIGKIDAELDALAQVFKDETWLGNPKWRRQPATK
jgi:DNA repair ATPase RecN